MPATNLIEQLQTDLHGHRFSYRTGGHGPLLVLLHGITNSSHSWKPVLPLLARHFTVLAPDLVGHGSSAKPRGDYSPGAYACLVRDLMIKLGHDRATLVGHSFGGGIAMQLAYQFPERVERLALVSSGALGEEVTFLLRAVALPGAELAVRVLASTPLLTAGRGLRRLLGRLGIHARSDIAEMAAGFASLNDRSARRAFLYTARAVIDAAGQRVTATDRLYLTAAIPTLVICGDRDPIIPVAHTTRAHATIPTSSLEVFAGAAHYPHHHSPERFAAVLLAFVSRTEPARVDDRHRRALMVEHAGGSGDPQAGAPVAPTR